MNMLFAIPWYVQLLVMSAVLVVSVYFHELGHYRMLREYYPQAERPRMFVKGWKFFAGVTWPRDVLTNEQAIEVIMLGVIVGVAPLIMLLWIVNPWVFALGLGLYFIGCRSDFAALIELRRNTW